MRQKLRMTALSLDNRKLSYKTDLGVFKSKEEADRYEILLSMQEKGTISQLQRRVSFTLLKAMYNNRAQRIEMKTKTKYIKKKVCVESVVTLVTDFVYYNKQGRIRAEVVKTEKEYKDPVYILKRKLIRYLHQIVLIENNKSNI